MPPATPILPQPENLSGLFNTFSLSLFAQQKYAAIIYDARGLPLWAANRHHHAYNQLLELAMKTPVRRIARLPRHDNLNGLFNSSRTNRWFLPTVDPETTKWVLKLFGAKPALTCFSRNRIEQTLFADARLATTPLSSLWLFRLSDTLFLGILSLSELLFRLTGASNRLLLALNTRGIPVAASPALRQRLDLAGYKGPIPPSPVIQNPTPLSPMGFPENPSAVLLENLELDNRSSETYRFAAISDSGVFDEVEFEILLECRIGDGYQFPGILFRADPARAEFPGSFPDYNGYNLSRQGNDWTLKRAGLPVARFNDPLPAETRRLSLTIRKNGYQLQFLRNKQPVGQWSETRPFLKAKHKCALIFLRPGMRSHVFRLELRQVPAKAIKPPTGRPLAVFEVPGGTLRLTVLNQELLQGPEPVNCLELEDMTALELRIRELEEERQKLLSGDRPVSTLVAVSPAMKRLTAGLTRVAKSGLTILIEGETGSGKEVLARAIHQESLKSRGPFVKIDFSTIPEALIEDELFGHEKGAFTGATAFRVGRIEQAHQGTLFLDEIANLPHSAQTKLLSVLQDRTVQRLGGNKSRKIDIRIVAASNRGMMGLVKSGRFRQDLFYRLNQISFMLPPLRDRTEDLPLLAGTFLSEACRETGRTVERFTPAALDRLRRHTWPGNVRELRNTVLRSVLFANTPVLGETDLLFENTLPDAPGGGRKRHRPNREDFAALLTQERGNLAAVARRMGATRQSVYRFIKKFGLTAENFRAWA